MAEERSDIIVESSMSLENAVESEAKLPEKTGEEKPADEPALDEKSKKKGESGTPKEEETPPEETSSDKKPDEDDSARKEKGRFQKRINELTRRIHDAERRAESAEKELENLKTKSSEEEKPPEQTSPPELKEPKEEDFEDYDDYLKAQREHTVQLARKEAREEVQKSKEELRKEIEAERLQEQEAKRREKVEEKFEEGRKKYEDFDEVALNEEVPYNDAMIEFVTESPHMAELAYHLGKNPEIAEKIFQMSPMTAARELIKLELSFKKENNKPPGNDNKPPGHEPIKPIGGGSDVSTKSINEIARNATEYRKFREAGGGK